MGSAFFIVNYYRKREHRKGNITLDTTLDPHVIEAPHGGPWLSLDQARVEPLPVGAQCIPMEETTLDQFVNALQQIVECSCVGLSQARATHRRQTVKGILEGLGDDDDTVMRWYIMEELERLGVIFATTMARKKDRKCRVMINRQ